MTGMAWKPDVTVAAVAERDGRFLFVEERAGGRIVLNQPAGHLEDGESLLDAVVRETLEETAWAFRPQAIVGVYLWRARAPQGRTFLRVAFCGDLRRHDPTRTPRPRHHPDAVADARRTARARRPAAQPRWSCSAWTTTSRACAIPSRSSVT